MAWRRCPAVPPSPDHTTPICTIVIFTYKLEAATAVFAFAIMFNFSTLGLLDWPNEKYLIFIVKIRCEN